MADEGRMDYTKRGLTKMADQLEKGDRVVIVLFDDKVCTPLENYVVGRDDPKLLQKVIDRMQPEGGTDMDLGLREGYAVASRKSDTHRRNRRVMAITVLSAGIIGLSNRISNRQHQAADRKQAFYLAEAGLAEAYAGLLAGRSGNVGSEADPARFGDGLFWVEATDEGADRVALESTGMVKSGRATLGLVAERGDVAVAALGIFSGQGLDVPSGVTIDGYDSRLGTYDAQEPRTARIASNGDIDVTGTEADPTTIDADLTAGPEREVSIAEDVTHSGTTGTAWEAVTLPPVEVPELTLGRGVRHTSPSPHVIPAGELGLEYLEVGAGAEVVLQGPATFVADHLVLESGATLTLDATSGPIRIYVGDGLSLGAGAAVATDAKAPEHVTIQVAGATEEPVELRATSAFEGVVYAPAAEVVVGPAFELHGALIADLLVLEPGARLHFDQELVGTARDSALPTFLSWRILELSTPTGSPTTRDPFRALGVDPATLARPADAHQDQRLVIKYEDTSGFLQSYDGWESAFDWSQVDTFVSGARDGVPFQPPGERGASVPRATGPPVANEPAGVDPVAEMLAAGGRTSAETRDALLAATPLTHQALVAVINLDTPMDSADLRAVLEANAPLRSAVLSQCINAAPLSSADLAAVLVASSPLTADVLTRVLARVPPLDLSDLLAVQGAQ